VVGGETEAARWAYLGHPRWSFVACDAGTPDRLPLRGEFVGIAG
jgi:hypothetical protein